MAEELKPSLLLFLKGFPAARPVKSKLEVLLSWCNVHQQLCVLKINEELSLLKINIASLSCCRLIKQGAGFTFCTC